MKDMFKELAEQMAITIRVMQITVGEYEGNTRECPFVSELKGQETAMKIMGIEFEYEFDDDYEITAVTVMGNRVEI